MTVVPSVFQGAGRTPGFWTSGTGALAYAPGDTRERQFRCVIFARNSTETPGIVRIDPNRLTNAREPIEQVELSPDRRWIAYNTAASGRSEVFVSSVPAGGERLQVSVEGAFKRRGAPMAASCTTSASMGRSTASLSGPAAPRFASARRTFSSARRCPSSAPSSTNIVRALTASGFSSACR
jgi:hypothetical protein